MTGIGVLGVVLEQIQEIRCKENRWRGYLVRYGPGLRSVMDSRYEPLPFSVLERILQIGGVAECRQDSTLGDLEVKVT